MNPTPKAVGFRKGCPLDPAAPADSDADTKLPVGVGWPPPLGFVDIMYPGGVPMITVPLCVPDGRIVMVIGAVIAPIPVYGTYSVAKIASTDSPDATEILEFPLCEAPPCGADFVALGPRFPPIGIEYPDGVSIIIVPFFVPVGGIVIVMGAVIAPIPVYGTYSVA